MSDIRSEYLLDALIEQLERFIQDQDVEDQVAWRLLQADPSEFEATFQAFEDPLLVLLDISEECWQAGIGTILALLKRCVHFRRL